MVRPVTDLEVFRYDLILLFETGSTYNDLVNWLKQEQNFSVGLRTLKRRFNEWGIQKNQDWVSFINSPDLQELVLHFFFERGLNDVEMLHALQHSGFSISGRILRATRLQMGLRRRLDDEQERALAFSSVRQLLEETTTQSGPIVERFGYRLVQTFLQQKHHHFSRERVREACRTVFPEAVQRRQYDQQRRRGQFIVPGPNYLWSIDGYDKLKLYGIEIYACIDAFSRYIIWIYVGISNHTQVSVVRQYMESVAARGIVPTVIRSDRGSETTMLANCQWQLRVGNDITAEFRDCYAYGPSTANQRIESWWAQLSKAALFVFRVCLSSETKSTG